MTENAAEFHYVVGGLLRRRGRALLVHRSPHRRWYPNVWDLPGGHVNETESAADALQRELGEELGIAVVSLGEPFRRLHGNDFRMDVWVVDRWLGEPENRDRCEHDALAWVDADEAAGLDLVHPQLLELLGTVLDPGDNHDAQLRDNGSMRGTLFFDGACGMCTRSRDLLVRLDRTGEVRTEPFQQSGTAERLGVPAERLADSAWWLDSSGRVFGGAEAVNAALAAALGTRLPLLVYRLPVVGWLQDFAYRWVANHRYRFPGTTPYCESHPDRC